jgi:hypothetical protein
MRVQTRFVEPREPVAAREAALLVPVVLDGSSRAVVSSQRQIPGFTDEILAEAVMPLGLHESKPGPCVDRPGGVQ